MRLYNRESSETGVEILQHDFDYSCLGKKIRLSSLANFNTLVNTFRGTAPQAIFDDNLAETSEAHPAIFPDNIDVNCKLIYSYYQAISS